MSRSVEDYDLLFFSLALPRRPICSVSFSPRFARVCVSVTLVFAPSCITVSHTSSLSSVIHWIPCTICSLAVAIARCETPHRSPYRIAFVLHIYSLLSPRFLPPGVPSARCHHSVSVSSSFAFAFPALGHIIGHAYSHSLLRISLSLLSIGLVFFRSVVLSNMDWSTWYVVIGTV